MSVEEKLERLFDKNLLTASWSADSKRLMVGWVTKIFNESRPHGEWIDTEFLKLKECSYCHVRWGMYDVENFNFCPNCGALMRKEGDENG